MVDEKKTGRVSAGQRMGAFIIDASPHEELGQIFKFTILEPFKVECGATSIFPFSYRT
jgi:hypothetical protein